MQGMATITHTSSLEGSRAAQREWARVSVRARIFVVRALRHRLAREAESVAVCVPTGLPGALHRNVADTLVAEVLPLIEACRFLERNTVKLLASRSLGSRGRPLWLSSVQTDVHRDPWGIVLILAPANYPLLLGGVQAIQALAAGNAVLWKPAPGTEAVAEKLCAMLIECGLPANLLTVIDAGVEAARAAIDAAVDYVVLTGSVETGTAVMHQLAQNLTPATMELSGSDAVFVLPEADMKHAIHALLFGLRFNGSFTCMAPRRLFFVGLAQSQTELFERKLLDAMRALPPVEVTTSTQSKITEILADARQHHATIALDGTAGNDGSLLVNASLILRAQPEMLAMRQDVFAPLLSVMRAASLDEAIAANDACPFALTAAIFGPERQARALASRLRVGHVLINDLIAPTADPRMAFGGRGMSGFGVTRGAEGLLAMTTPRTVQLQRSKSTRAYQQTTSGHAPIFAGLIAALHAENLTTRWRGLRRMIQAARSLRNRKPDNSTTSETSR